MTAPVVDPLAALVSYYKALGVQRVFTDPPKSSTLPLSSYPYLIVYPATPQAVVEVLAHVRSAWVFEWSTVAVGLDVPGAASVARRVAAADETRLPIPGWISHPIEHLGSRKYTVDESLPDRTVGSFGDNWSVRLSPA